MSSNNEYYTKDKSEEYLIKFIEFISKRKWKENLFLFLQCFSLILVVACMSDTYWLSSSRGHQGLWRHCYIYGNSTATCCGKLDKIVGTQGFVWATRVFIIIEFVAYLCFPLLLACTFRNLKRKSQSVEVIVDCYRACAICSSVIAFSSVLAVVIYASVHHDIREDMRLNRTFFVFCINNVFQIISCILPFLCLNELPEVNPGQNQQP